MWGAPLSIAGALALIAAFARPHINGPVTRGLQFLGRSSIVFYASHFPIMALLSQSSLAEGSFLMLAALNLAASVLLGSVLAVWKSAPPAIWLFQAPSCITAASARVMSLLTTRGELPAPQVGTRRARPTQVSE